MKYKLKTSQLIEKFLVYMSINNCIVLESIFIINVTNMAIPVVNPKVNKGHFILPVSFFIVRRVVPQGKWSKVNNIKLRVVIKVQPLSKSNDFNIFISSNCNMTPFDI